MKKKYFIASILSVLIIFIGVSLAYFTTIIISNRKDISVTTKELKIVFTDSPAFNATNIAPGWDLTKTFTIENQSGDTYVYDLSIKDLINTFVSGGWFQYKIESTNSGYNTNNEWIDMPKRTTAKDTTLAHSVSIANNVTQTYTLYLRYPDSGENQDEDQGCSFSGRLAVTAGSTPTLMYKLLEANPTRSTRTSFDDVFTTENTGTLYTTNNTEDGSAVYYFAGNALNNWVKFGKCTSADYNCTVGDDLYWRIIRTNEDIEDGGIRLLYAGSGSVTNQNAYIDSGTKFSAVSGDPSSMGYMYGSTGSLVNNRTNQTIRDNTVASYISDWYSSTFDNDSDNNTKDSSGNLLTDYINSSAIYCNDRSISSGTYSSKNFQCGAYTRLVDNNNPSYACGATEKGHGYYFEGGTTGVIADKFTGNANNSSNTEVGNGLLGNTPAALVTADEIVFAGGKQNYDSPAWYYYNAASEPSSITSAYWWWTMTPRNSHLLVSMNFVNGSSNPGRLYNAYPNNTNVVIRPVISLKADVLWVSGNGSPSSPFEVEI